MAAKLCAHNHVPKMLLPTNNTSYLPEASAHPLYQTIQLHFRSGSAGITSSTAVISYYCLYYYPCNCVAIVGAQIRVQYNR